MLTALFGGMTTEAEKELKATTPVASENETPATLKNVGEEVHHTEKELAAMTTEEALATLKAQLAETSEKVLARCTSLKKVKKELEKAEKKEKETLAEYTLAFMDTTTSEKKKACVKENSNFWHTMKETLEALYTEEVKKEAEKALKEKALKEKALATLKALAEATTTMEEVEATMTTEELEALKKVATEKKAEKKEAQLKATNEATEATTMEKKATLAMYTRHEEEGKATEEELAHLRVNDVEKSMEATMKELAEEEKEAEKKEEGKTLKKAEAEATKKEYTLSKAIAHMKEEAEVWQNLLDLRGVEVKVATMTPASVFSNIHPFFQVPTGEGIKAGTGRGITPVSKWTIEGLYRWIWRNDRLHKKALAEEVLEAHMEKVLKAEEALKKVAEVKALKEAMKKEKEEKKAEKELAEAATSEASVEELEKVAEELATATSNEKALKETEKELKAEAMEALATLKEKETPATMTPATMTMEALKAEAEVKEEETPATMEEVLEATA